MRPHRPALQTVTPTGDDALRKAGNEADTMTDMSKHNTGLKTFSVVAQCVLIKTKCCD